MKSQPLDNEQQLQNIIDATNYSIIFKHNTTCPISKATKADLEENSSLVPDDACVYFLDLLKHRDISDAIADQFSVAHESPQLLLIKDGYCVYNASMYDITAEDVAQAIDTEA